MSTKCDGLLGQAGQLMMSTRLCHINNCFEVTRQIDKVDSLLLMAPTCSFKLSV